MDINPFNMMNNQLGMAQLMRPTGVEGLPFYQAIAMTAGVNINAADISIGPQAINVLPLTLKTVNWSAGRTAGWTTRYGIFPVQGHNSQEPGFAITANALKGYSMQSVVGAEQATAPHPQTGFDVYGLRTFLFGAAVIPLPVGVNGATVPVVYWMSARNLPGGGSRFDIMPSTDYIATGQQMRVASHFEAPVGGGTAMLSMGFMQNPLVVPEYARALQAIDRLHTYDLVALRALPATFTQRYMRWTLCQTSISVNAKEFLVRANGSGDPGTKPYDGLFGFLGCPFWITANPQQRRPISVSVLSAYNAGGTPKQWMNNWFLSQQAGDFIPTPMTNRSNNNSFVPDANGGVFGMNGVSNGYVVSNTTVTSYYYVRVSDQPMTVPVSLLAMIASRPIIALFNPYVRDSTEQINYGDYNATTNGNDFVQWLDPTSNFYAPGVYNTVQPGGGGAYHETNQAAGTAVPVQTCWGGAPDFVFGTNTSNVVTGVGGGLNADTVYEYAYSIYNALTGKESNVGKPAKAFVSAAGSAIQVYKSTTNSGMNPGDNCLFPFIGFEPSTFASSQFWYPQAAFNGLNFACMCAPVNYMYYRLYYRQQGDFEWLSAGEHSLAKVHFGPFVDAIYIGQTSNVGSVGGQPGGFNDYSDLPVDNYIDVCTFRGRLFWMTRGQLLWSRSDDPLSYPARCSFPAPSGELRGMVPHYFYGEAEATGRLVIFASDGMYEGRFTGNFMQDQVRVSATAQPIAVNVDGTDFDVSMRSSETAFSGRCAVVAEGILYFMGPDGFWRDDGVNTPMRISQGIEPDFFDMYDPSTTDEFFAYYNKRSREVIFFYRPNPDRPDLNPDGYKTVAWVYSLRTENIISNSINASNLVPGAWYPYGYTSVIDWAQDLDLTRLETPTPLGTKRTLVGVRAATNSTVSRPYFHDDNCDGGDYAPGNELMVKQISYPDSTTLRFTLAKGWQASTLAGVVAGTTEVAAKLSSTYGGLSTTANVDGLYTIKAFDSVGGTIDVDSTGVTAPATTFTTAQFFPLFLQGVHDFKAVFQPHYLCPMGLFSWQLVRYSHFLIKPITQTLGNAQPMFTAQWEPNHQQGTSLAEKSLPLFPLNSRETTTQLLVDIPSPDSQALAQAVRPTLTYNQLAGRWTLYALTHYYSPAGEDETKMYQRSEG